MPALLLVLARFLVGGRFLIYLIPFAMAFLQFFATEKIAFEILEPLINDIKTNISTSTNSLGPWFAFMLYESKILSLFTSYLTGYISAIVLQRSTKALSNLDSKVKAS